VLSRPGGLRPESKRNPIGMPNWSLSNLSEGGCAEGRDFAPAASAGMRQRVAHNVALAARSGGGETSGTGCRDTIVGAVANELHTQKVTF
jgi:hypothetical protein